MSNKAWDRRRRGKRLMIAIHTVRRYPEVVVVVTPEVVAMSVERYRALTAGTTP